MSKSYDNVARNIHKYSDYKALKKELADLPTETLDYIKKNFKGAEGAQMVLDITGMIEPTPFSDIAGGILAIARGDWLSAGTSLMGIVPYIGDTGKIGKWASRALTDKRYGHVVKSIGKYTNIKRKIAVLTQTKALAKTKKEMWEYYKRHKNGDMCELCKAASKKVKLPKHGKWKPGPPGENGSKWFPDEKSGMSPDMQKMINDKGGVPFHEGMPDYSNFAKELPPPGSGLKNLPIEMNGKPGDINRSFDQYNDMMKKNEPDWSQNKLDALKTTHTWHHTDQGMQLVPKGLHNPSLGGPSHVGARSWLSWPNY